MSEVEGTVFRPALGQNFSIGQLYNIHEDKPLVSFPWICLKISNCSLQTTAIRRSIAEKVVHFKFVYIEIEYTN